MITPATPKPVKIGVRSKPTCASAINKPMKKIAFPDMEIKNSCMSCDIRKFGEPTARLTIRVVRLRSNLKTKIMTIKINTLNNICGVLCSNHCPIFSAQLEAIDHITLVFNKSLVTLPVVSNNCFLYEDVSIPMVSPNCTKYCNVLMSLSTLRVAKICSN